MSDFVASGGSERLNPAQANNLLASAQYIDELLADVLKLAAPIPDSPLVTQYVHDISEERADQIREAVGLFREQLKEGLATLGVQSPAPRLSARHAAHVTLVFCLEALGKWDQHTLTGYGSLSPDMARRVVSVRDRLQDQLRRIADMLGPAGHE